VSEACAYWRSDDRALHHPALALGAVSVTLFSWTNGRGTQLHRCRSSASVCDCADTACPRRLRLPCDEGLNDDDGCCCRRINDSTSPGQWQATTASTCAGDSSSYSHSKCSLLSTVLPSMCQLRCQCWSRVKHPMLLRAQAAHATSVCDGQLSRHAIQR
jgi:hypothetical protein